MQQQLLLLWEDPLIVLSLPVVHTPQRRAMYIHLAALLEELYQWGHTKPTEASSSSKQQQQNSNNELQQQAAAANTTSKLQQQAAALPSGAVS